MQRHHFMCAITGSIQHGIGDGAVVLKPFKAGVSGRPGRRFRPAKGGSPGRRYRPLRGGKS